MYAGERMVGANGKECFLFPLEDMWITQGSYTATYSHNGSYAMDFDGYLNGSFQTHVPFYAPFSCHLVAKWGRATNYQAVWESNEEVNFVDGDTAYACFAYNHDEGIPDLVIGQTLQQGDLMGHTGKYGASNDHIHIEAKKGLYAGAHANSYGVWMLTGSTWLYNLMGVNDTNLVHPYYVNHNNVRVNYPWKEFTDSPIPPGPSPVPWAGRTKFPWVLYARKLRDKRNKM